MRRRKTPLDAFEEREKGGTFELAVSLRDKTELEDLYERLGEEGYECWVLKCEEE